MRKTCRRQYISSKNVWRFFILYFLSGVIGEGVVIGLLTALGYDALG